MSARSRVLRRPGRRVPAPRGSACGARRRVLRRQLRPRRAAPRLCRRGSSRASSSSSRLSRVPETTKLPTTVRVPVPEGATVQWAGEVLGGDLSADPARTYKMIKSPVGGQYAEFTLGADAQSAQVDADMAAVTVERCGDLGVVRLDPVGRVAVHVVLGARARQRVGREVHAAARRRSRTPTQRASGCTRASRAHARSRGRSSRSRSATRRRPSAPARRQATSVDHSLVLRPGRRPRGGA